MQVKISLTNSKLGAQIPSVSLLPAHSCRADAPCAKLCYGKKGNYRFSSAQKSQAHNVACYINDSKQYFNDIVSFLKDKLITYKYFRWHAVGDIINEDYFSGMIEVAKKCKNIKFLCFTKKFFIVNEYLNKGNKIPNNLKIVFSAWDRAFEVKNPHNLPVAYVYFKNTELNPDIPELSIPCVGKCNECQSCWSLKNGQSVVFNQH